MADGRSKAHQRQASANKTRRQAHREACVVEQNQMRRLLREARRQGLAIHIGPNSSEVSFVRLVNDDGRKVERVVDDLTAAWRRCANKAGIAKSRAILAARGIPQANTKIAFVPPCLVSPLKLAA